jgi:lauroyl/myristoyl acyltransferase
VFVDRGHHHVVVLPPLDTERRGRLRADVHRVTQDLAHALEQLIARDPVQWHMLQPAWPDLDPDASTPDGGDGAAAGAPIAHG